MLIISNLCKQTPLNSLLLLQTRNKMKIHWAKLKKKTSPKYKAMNHFDDFYGSVFGEKWGSIKEALLRRPKYVALVNNYGDADETMEYLTNRGAHCLKNLIKVQKEFHNQYTVTPTDTQKPIETSTLAHSKKLEQYATKLQVDEMSAMYPQGDDFSERIHEALRSDNKEEEKKETLEPTNKTLEQSIAEAEIDESRIINPSMSMMSEALYQFLPATKLKGMEEWIPESLHYSYFSKGKDFPLVIEQDEELIYPEHLKVFTYEMESESTMFPEPKRCQTGVFNYYPLDCGSVVAVLALGLAPGDRVLDLCSAPGGKALVALQTLLPDVIVCNDPSISRCNRMRRIFKDYLFDFETSNKWRERVLLKHVDGRVYTDDLGFDKVLVDVPCTTDRVSVNEDENNIFRPDRIKERLRIPELQSQLLANALRLVRVGGTVVYATCSLSPVQNDGVVHLALKHAFESHSIIATIKDMSSSLVGLSSTLRLAGDASAPRYGQLVTPAAAANFGPSYIAKLVRIK